MSVLMNHRLGCPCVLVMIAVAGVALPVSAVPVSYTLEATVCPASRRIVGTNRFELVNRTDAPLDVFPLMLYPNHYARYDTAITSDLFDRVFPAGVSLGGMRLTAVVAGGVTCGIEARDEGVLAAGVTAAIRLPHALPPGGRIAMQVGFETRIPARYGAFGAYRGGLCLNGGWYPYLPAVTADGRWALHAPPPPAHFDLVLHAADAGHYFINGHHHPPARNRGIDGAFRTDFLTLLYYPALHVQEADSPHGNMRYITRRPRGRAARRLFAALERALDRRDGADIRPVPAGLVLLEAPLRRDLAIVGRGAVLVSDRFDDVFFAARDYHIAPLVEAVYTLLLRAQVQRPADGGFDWELEALAWLEARRFWSRYSRRADSARAYLKPFGFIPEVDRWLHAPRFPFVGTFFGDFHADDPLREDITRFNRPVAHGRIVAEKLRDLLGDDALTEGTARALGEGEALQSALEARYGASLTPFVQQWTDPYPAMNYVLAGWRQRRDPTGGWRSEVTVRREGHQVHEPVAVAVSRRGGDSARAVWPGDEPSGTVALATARKMSRVTIDPDRRLRETTRDDNRLPAGYRILLDNLRLSIDLNGRDHEFGASGSVIPGTGYRHRYRFFGFADQEQNGLELRHIYAFGNPLDGTDYRHDLYWGGLHADLDSGFADSASGRTNVPGRAVAIKAGYTLRTAEGGRNRLSGWTTYLEGEVGATGLSGDFNYWKSRVAAEGVIPLVRDRHLLGLRGSIGIADRETPTQLLFDLGGFDGIRGINRGLALGSRRWMASIEYRHMLLRDLTVQVATLAWLRRLQLALYIDTGNVSDHDGELFGDKPHWGAGLGFRLHVDTLGAFPAVWRLDVARQLDGDTLSGDRPLMYYLGAGQSF